MQTTNSIYHKQGVVNTIKLNTRNLFLFTLQHAKQIEKKDFISYMFCKLCSVR